MATLIIYALPSLDASIEMLGKVSSIAFIAVFSVLFAILLISQLHKARVIYAPTWYARVNNLLGGDSLLANFLSYLTNVEFKSELKAPLTASINLPRDERREITSVDEEEDRTLVGTTIPSSALRLPLTTQPNIEFSGELKTPPPSVRNRSSKEKSEAPSVSEKEQRIFDDIYYLVASQLPLTPRQIEFFDFLVNFQRQQGYSPTVAQIQEHFGLRSSTSVHQKLMELENAGLIRRNKYAHRGIEIIQRSKESEKQTSKPKETEKQMPKPKKGEASSAFWEIPLLGIIAAGLPIQAYVTSETLSVPADMYSPNRFALKVRGESMRDEQIFDGDFIIAEPAGNKPLHGKTVVALIDESEATVKKFYDERLQIRLQPANDNFEPILISPPDRVKVQGVVVGLIRKFR